MTTLSQDITAVDPYDPFDNPLGTQGLSMSNLGAVDTVMQGQAYAFLITTQELLDVSTIDVGLAVKATAYQKQLRGQANYFLNTLVPDYIRLVVDANSLATLIEAFARQERSDILRSFEDAGTRRTLGTVLDALSETAGETYVDTGTFVNHVSAANQVLSTLGGGLDAIIETTISDLDTSIQATSKSIDDLTKAIYQNIDDIVAGANQAGDAIKDLGIGLLTTFAGAAVDPTPKKPGSGDGDKPATGDRDDGAGG
jgi:methyl-accepting chemotaxis protein